MARDPRTIVWLASYPKSGNTWLRALLANYFTDTDRPVSINEIHRITFGDSSGPAFAELARRSHRLLTREEVVTLRLRNLERISRHGAVNFVKTHNANIRVAGRPLIPAHVTRGAIYIVRDPRDLVISYADHWRIPIEEAVAQIAAPDNMVPSGPKTVMQFLGNWSEHVRGWTRARDFRVLLLRYEEMLADTEAAFEKVLRFIGAPIDRGVLRQAVEFSRFDELTRQEEKQGFREKDPRQPRFFRAGRAGQWRELLAPELVARIEAEHGAVMRRLGYLKEVEA